MEYLGLARKYRPNTFSEVVGQKEIAETLQNTIRQNRIHHAYLFCGSRGVGKTSMARIFAKALNCEKGVTPTPCCECELCKKIAVGEDVDVIEIDGASNRGIEEIRNIRENIKYLPARARFKIFIIDEIHMLTTPAFNALLKTLEEPPEHVKFIFATTQMYSIPDTILSRCQRFTFKTISSEDITNHLKNIAEKEHINITPDVLERISLHTGGALRDSLVLLDQLACYNTDSITMEVFEKITGNVGNESLQIIESLNKKESREVLHLIGTFFVQGGNPSTLVDEIIQKYRDILIVTLTNDLSCIDGSEQYKNWLQVQSKNVSPDFLYGAIYSLLEAKNLIQRSLLGRIVLEVALLKLLNMDSFLSIKEMEQKVLNLESDVFRKASLIPANPVRNEPTQMQMPVRNEPTQMQMPTPIRNEPMQMPTPIRNEPMQMPTPIRNEPTQMPTPIRNEPTQMPTPIRNEPMQMPTPIRNEPMQMPTPIRNEPMQMPTPVRNSKSKRDYAPQKNTNNIDPWAYLLQKFPSEKMASLIEKVSQHKIENNTLFIILPQDNEMLADVIHEKYKEISDLVHQAYGEHIQFKIQFTGERQRKTDSQLHEHPLVRYAIDLFNAHVI